MKCIFFLFIAVLLMGQEPSQAQTNAAADQNPSFAVSRDRYLALADSLNALHSITLQDTYKAIDYLEDKHEARQVRRATRREYRLQNSFNNWPYDYNYYSPFSPAPFYHSYRPRYYSNNYLWPALPLAFMLGRWSR